MKKDIQNYPAKIIRPHGHATSGIMFCLCFFFRSTLLSRPNKLGHKCSSVRMYVRPSTKSFFDFNKIWLVGKGR